VAGDASEGGLIPMYDRGAMVRRSRGRYLAPIVLAATITGTYLIVHNGLTHKSSTTHSHVSKRPTTTRHGRFARVKFYVVKRGDTLSSISQKTGVSIQTLQALNHKLVDPNSLQTAQRLRLRR
jgi:LysM repeat protein